MGRWYVRRADGTVVSYEADAGRSARERALGDNAATGTAALRGGGRR
eukprot:gene2240-7292_t